MDDVSGNGAGTGNTDVVVPDGPPPRDPSEIRDPLPQPLVSWRRVVIAAILLVAFGCLVVAVRSSGSDADVAATDKAILSYAPAPGSRVLRQSRVGVELEPGYDGRLTIDGVTIPEEQMVGAIVPGTEAWDQLSEEERAAGPRPNTKNVVMYQPGEGKAVDSYDTGAVEVKVRFWRIANGPQSARTVTYTINVT